MRYRLFQIDAFTDRVFQGNPAAVCVMGEWPEEEIMQKVAAENNLAETAFLVPYEDGYFIRWFTPKVEIDLCGHATLAAAYVLYEYFYYTDAKINFFTKNSGNLWIEKKGDTLSMNFPVDKFKKTTLPESLKNAFEIQPKEVYKGRTDYMLVYENELQIRNMQPKLDLIKNTDCRGVIITAEGESYDVVSRFFAPGLGIPEDPVTGSAHTTLTPYWTERLMKKVLHAKQLSERTGEIICHLQGERVMLEGKAVTFLEGEIEF